MNLFYKNSNKLGKYDETILKKMPQQSNECDEKCFGAFNPKNHPKNKHFNRAYNTSSSIYVILRIN